MKIITSFLAVLTACFLALAPAQASSEKKGSYIPVDTPPASAQQVKIGFYPVSVYQLDMSSNTYYVDTYIWLRWKGDIDPTGTIEFTNMVEEWGKQQENLLSEVKLLPDGSKYQIMRIEGRFVQPFSLADYPLDRQKLSIMVEDTTNGADVVSYVIDKEGSGIGDSLQIPGWKLGGWTSQIYTHDYGTKFGEEETPSAYSAAQFSIEISRPLSFFFWKLLLPLFIVLGAALSSLLIRPQDLDVRSTLPAGALLTSIFLQKSYSDNLPDLGYLILMDKIYLVVYALIVLTLIRAIFAYRAAADADAGVIRAVQATDRKLLILQVAAFLVVTAGIVLLR
ncbi:hypothetical protein [Aestuariivirga sp.]|jgi:hypothetical protein|uniref:hypothetical protein n=1 Tax=Aestuariivirga sp. TaxID=2650926 RepID=UPI0037852500